jgi:hypothetical protein
MRLCYFNFINIIKFMASRTPLSMYVLIKVDQAFQTYTANLLMLFHIVNKYIMAGH